MQSSLCASSKPAAENLTGWRLVPEDVEWQCDCPDPECTEPTLHCQKFWLQHSDLGNYLSIPTGALYKDLATGRLKRPGTAQIREWMYSNVHYRPADVVVATFPKCGTTLAEQIVLLLLNGGNAEQLDPLSKNAANLHGGPFGKVWADACILPEHRVAAYRGGGGEEFVPRTVDWFNSLPSPRVIKTHQPAWPGSLLGGEDARSDGSHTQLLAPGAKYIVVARNPFDTCVSFLHHAGFPVRDNWPFEAWVEAFCTADQHSNVGSWFTWHRSWWQLAQSDQVLWVHYEELLSHPEAQISRIAQFMGIEHGTRLVERVAAGSAFKNMKSAAVKTKGSGGRNNSAAHLRSGKRGGWRSQFSDQAAQRIRNAFTVHFGGSGLEFDLGNGEMLRAE